MGSSIADRPVMKHRETSVDASPFKRVTVMEQVSSDQQTSRFIKIILLFGMAKGLVAARHFSQKKGTGSAQGRVAPKVTNASDAPASIGNASPLASTQVGLFLGLLDRGRMTTRLLRPFPAKRDCQRLTLSQACTRSRLEGFRLTRRLFLWVSWI
jgi:hypothetical protein